MSALITTTPELTYRPPLCPQCGYSFETLPSAGACPECGLQYGPDHILLFVWGPNSHPIVGKSSISFIFICCFFSLCAAVIIVEPFLLPGFTFSKAVLVYKAVPAMALAQLVPLAEMLGGLFFLTHRRRRLRALPAPVQLRLSPAGFAVRQGLGNAKLRPWRPTTRFSLRTKKNGQLQFLLRRKRRFELQLYPVLPPGTASAIASRVDAWIIATGQH